jgi:O-glycosyl hydrolase
MNHRFETFQKSVTLATCLLLLAMVFFTSAITAPPASAQKGKPPTNTPQPSPTATPSGSDPTPTPTPAPAGAVNVWVTTGDKSKLLAQQADVTFGSDTTSGLLIHVNANHLYQEMDGFGAAMSDSSAWLIYNKLSTSQRNDLMQKLFSSTNGIGMSYVRLPMGASDFVVGDHYTYNDMPLGQTDPNLTNFSIAHDQAYIIPVLQQARSINPLLKIMASPWSAPAWMKTNDSLYGGGALRSNYQGSYANYFVKFVDAYAAAGVPINSVTVQNEIEHKPGNYPGMWMTAAQQADFVKNNLGPALANKNVKIILLDHNWTLPYYALDVLSDSSAKAYADGTAFHCYGGDPAYQTMVRDAHPDRNIYFTECSSGNWATNWESNLMWDVNNLVIGSSRNWSRTVIKWNIALDTNFGPYNGGCTECTGLVTINQSNGAVTFNHDYYAIGHASKFVAPGARRIASTSLVSNGVTSVAFKNPDGTIVLVVGNDATRSQTFKVRWGGQSFQYSLPKKSVATFVWGGTQATPSVASAPTTLTASVSSQRVVLKWEFSHLAATYNVKRATSSGGPYTTIANGVALPEYFDTSVSNGQTYYYIVTAVNGNGESAASNQASAIPNTPPVVNATSQIEVESFDGQSGIGIEQCNDQSGCGLSIGYTDEGDYIFWNQVDFGSSVSSVDLRVASGSNGGTVEFRLDSPTGTLIASAVIPNTGGWGTWKTYNVPVSGASGTQKLYIVFRGPNPETSADGLLNINWVRFK